MLTVLYQDANKMFYDLGGQINNLYNMHARTSVTNNNSAVKDMSENDVELIRERIGLLKDKVESLSRTFGQDEIRSTLTPDKQTFWRKRIEQLTMNAEKLPIDLERALRNFHR